MAEIAAGSVAVPQLTARDLEALRAPTIHTNMRLHIEPRRPTPRPFDSAALAALRDYVFHWIEMAVRSRYRPGVAPPCRRVELLHELSGDALELRLEAYDGQQFLCTRGSTFDGQTLSWLGFERICQLFFDGAAAVFNDRPTRYFDWRSDVELRNRLEDALRGLAPLPSTAEGYQLLGVDPGASADRTAVTLRNVVVTANRRDGFYVGGFDFEPDLYRREAAAIREQAFRIEQEMIVYGGGRREGRTWNPFDGPQAALFAERDAAEARGEKLLREWLSPQQLAQYEGNRYFDVIGSSSKRRYRITQGRSFNVLLLDADDGIEEEICFMPVGNLVTGDIMLAQKVALETDEPAAIEVANRQYVGRRIRPGAWGLLNGSIFNFSGA